MTIQLNAGATQPLNSTAQAGVTMPQTQPATGAQTRPKLNAIKRKSLPTGVASNVKQHVLVLSDISSSMIGPKLDELILARRGLVAELADPANKDGFLVTLIDFNHAAHVICSAVPATSLVVPDPVGGGGTNYDPPINASIAAIKAHNALPNVEGWYYLQPNVMILSDGRASVADKNIREQQELATVSTIAYGADADQATLARMASDGQVHVVGTDGGQLRDFLAQVGKTMTSTMASAI